MIHWLVQTLADHPDLERGAPPPGLLSPAESAQLAGFRVAKRRRDWLLGRWTAKHLLQTTLDDEMGFRLPLNAYTIEPDASGAPHAAFDVSWAGAPAGELADVSFVESLSLSISHSGDHAFCALSLMDDARVGADIECIEPRSVAFLEQFFTPEEAANVIAAPPDLQPLWATLIWSAKESALKALRLGLTVDCRGVSCTVNLPQPGAGADVAPLGYLWSRFGVQIAPDLLHEAGMSAAGRCREASGWWQIMSNYVLTMVLIS